MPKKPLLSHLQVHTPGPRSFASQCITSGFFQPRVPNGLVRPPTEQVRSQRHAEKQERIGRGLHMLEMVHYMSAVPMEGNLPTV